MMKTRDGISIKDLLSAARNIPGVTIREGTKHAYMLNYAGLRPCPIAESTYAKHMVVPWIKQITQYDNNTIYRHLKNGTWQ